MMKALKNIKKIYDHSANSYDECHFASDSAAEYVERQRLNIIMPYLMNLHDKRVLDVACGTGTYLDIARRNGAFAVGCDLSENMVIRSKRKGIENCLINDYCKLPFKDASFDLVLCINSIHYSFNPEETLNEIKRVLSDDGIVLFSYFNILNIRSINKLRKLYLKNTQISYERRYLSIKIKELFNKFDLIPIYHIGINILPFAVDEKTRNKNILKFLTILENRMNQSIFRHLLNESFMVIANQTHMSSVKPTIPL